MGERAVALVDRAVQNFVSGFPTTADSVRRAVAAGDAAEVRALTHKLRGSASTLGATRVAAAAQELEDLADLGTVTGCELLVDRLASAGVEACDALVLERFGQAAAKPAARCRSAPSLSHGPGCSSARARTAASRR